MLTHTARSSGRDIVALDALSLSAAIHGKHVSCREVMTAYLDHIDALNPLVNAIVSLRDRDVLMAEAKNRDEALARGDSLGWLHGIPQAVKDLTATAGVRTTFGSALFQDHVPELDAPTVQRMKRDGAIIIGKTNTPEFGLGSQTYNEVFGVTRNPHDLTKTAGGSSGGAAAALAARMLPVADGSDMMGSLRNPAAFNNVIGFRPTTGRIPGDPAADVFGQRLGTIGPMGRTVADVARLFATLSQPDSGKPPVAAQGGRYGQPDLERDLDGCRVGWLGDWDGYLPMEPEVLTLCEQAIPVFENLGCVVESAVPDFHPERLWQAWLVLRQTTIAAKLKPAYADADKRQRLKPEARWEVEGGLARSAMDVLEASMTRSAWYRALCSMFETYDYLLIPSAQVFPFDAQLHWPQSIQGKTMDTYHRWMEVATMGTLAAGPVISVPVGFSRDGLPMGLQILGPYGADGAVLQTAFAYEQAFGLQQGIPPSIIELDTLVV